MTTLAPALQSYFTERLISQRAASPNTIAGYRQTFRLLLAFASARCGRTPSQLGIDDLDAPLVSAFLAHLESDRGNSPATRNNRPKDHLIPVTNHRRCEHSSITTFQVVHRLLDISC